MLDDACADARLILVQEGLVAVRGERRPDWRPVLKQIGGRGDVILAPGSDESVHALSEARLRPLSGATLARLWEDSAASSFLVEGLEASLRQVQEAIGGLAHVHHLDRVRDFLLLLARTHGRVDRGHGIRIDVKLTHELIAEAVSSARETVSRAMESLQDDGFVVRERGVYRLLVPPDEL
jgi:CRP/FNR family cyclic AMP-dependent transcriptional regulator